MHPRNFSAVSSAALATMVAFLWALAIPHADAGLIYTWDRGAATDAWATNTNWDVGGADPLTAPGSAYSGFMDDRVIITAASVGAAVTVNLPADAGTIDSLIIGGGGYASTLSLNNAASVLTVTNNVTLGALDGTNQRAGDLNVGNNNAATMTVSGNIVSGSTGDHDLTINGTGATLNLAGDIDTLGTNRIDLWIHRGTQRLVLTGAGAQALNVQEFHLADIGAATVTAEWTLGPNKTLIASERGDIGRNSSGAGEGTNRTATGTLNIYGGTATFAEFVLGNVSNQPTTAARTQTAIGTVKVGDAGNAGTLTVNGELRLAPVQNLKVGGGQGVGTGALVVNNAGSVVNLNGGLEMAANSTDNTQATATVTVNAGLVNVYNHVEDGVGASTINLGGGTLHLATPTTVTFRAVDTFNMEDGATLRMTVTGQAMPLTGKTAIDLQKSGDVGGGSALFDLRNGPPDILVSTAESVEWVGGTGTWDATASNWSLNVIPSQAAVPLISGVTKLTLLDGGGNNIANLANAALAGPEAGNWTLDTSDPTKLRADYVGANTGFGPVRATISDAADVVSRNTDLVILNAAGQGADASQLDISDGSLTLNPAGATDLILGGAGATGNVNQTGGTVSIGGVLQFGKGNPGDNGGLYRLAGGSLTVNGDDGLGNSVTMPDTSIGSAGLYIDGGTLTAAGNILVRGFRVGDAEGSNASYALPDGRTLRAVDDLIVGEYGSAAMTVGGGGAGAAVTVGDDLFVAHADPTAGTTVGSLTINQNSVVNVGDQVRMGGSNGSTSTLTLNGGTLITGGTFVDSDEDGSSSVLNINSGTLSVGGIMYLGDDQTAKTGQSQVNIGVGGGAPNVSVGQLRVGWWSASTLVMESGTLTSAQGVAGGNATGAWEIRAGTATFTGEVKAGDVAGSNGTIKVGQFGGNPTIYVSGGNTEIPEDGTGTFELYSGAWYQQDNNFVQGQSDAAKSTVKIFGGTLDLTGLAGTHTGQWNVNDGTSTTDILGGLVRIGGALQLTDENDDFLVFTIGDNLGASPLVLVGINGTDGINYRNNGTDTINFRSGTLDLTGGVIDADTTGANAFNWTGGTLKDVSQFQGSLVQGNADSPSLLKIGASPGAMSVTADYTLDNAGTHESTLEVELFGMGGVAGADYDFLSVTGTATFYATSDIDLILYGYTPVLGDMWDILDAGAIVVVGNVNDLFDTSQAPLDPGLFWDFSNFATDGTIGVTPEPATLALLGLGAAAALVLRRRA